jgi:hypothetical protein
MSELLESVEPIAEPIRKGVLADLETRISPWLEESWSELAEEISGLAVALERSNAWRVQDRPGAIYLKISCVLLAIHRTLELRFDDRQELLDVLKSVIDGFAFPGGVEAFLLDRFGISPDAPGEAWDCVRCGFLERGRERYGSGWSFEQGIRDERRYFVNIRRCGFADFFLENGAREVLYLLCATDYLWGDALEEYGVRFERPTALSEGSDACRLQFFKIGE